MKLKSNDAINHYTRPSGFQTLSETGPLLSAHRSSAIFQYGHVALRFEIFSLASICYRKNEIARHFRCQRVIGRAHQCKITS